MKNNTTLTIRYDFQRKLGKREKSKRQNMGTTFQLGLDGINAIDGQSVDCPDGSSVCVENGSAQIMSPDIIEEPKAARTFQIGLTGLEAMMDDNGIKSLETDAGQVTVASRDEITVHDIPGFTQGLDDQAPTNTPIPGLS